MKKIKALFSNITQSALWNFPVTSNISISQTVYWSGVIYYYISIFIIFNTYVISAIMYNSSYYNLTLLDCIIQHSFLLRT